MPIHAKGKQKETEGWVLMSALGQKRTFGDVPRMSALPPKADIGAQSRDVRFVPKADIAVRDYLVGRCRGDELH